MHPTIVFLIGPFAIAAIVLTIVALVSNERRVGGPTPFAGAIASAIGLVLTAAIPIFVILWVATKIETGALAF